ncbi:MAG: hypothetical protein Q4B63_10355 [Clostridium perfringens]|nr:hypothetical protein [Clostridium perfringens]
MKEVGNMVPQNIRLLFENEQLSIIKVLSLLQVLRNKSKRKYYTIEDITFYYSIVNFDLIKIFSKDININDLMKNRNKYLRFSKSVNQIILELSNLKYIDIRGDIFYKKEQLKIKLNEKGETFIKIFNSEYFIDIQELYEDVIENIVNNSANKNKVKGLLK